MEKISDSFPVVGGVTLPLLSLPTMTTIAQTVILAFIGALVGFLSKLLFEYIYKKLKG